jgi:hypothetical protein
MLIHELARGSLTYSQLALADQQAMEELSPPVPAKISSPIASCKKS